MRLKSGKSQEFRHFTFLVNNFGKDLKMSQEGFCGKFATACRPGVKHEKKLVSGCRRVEILSNQSICWKFFCFSFPIFRTLLGTHQCNGMAECFDMQGSYQCHCHTLGGASYDRCGKFHFPTKAGQEFAPNPYEPAENTCQRGFYIPIQSYGAGANLKIALHSHTQVS